MSPSGKQVPQQQLPQSPLPAPPAAREPAPGRGICPPGSRCRQQAGRGTGRWEPERPPAPSGVVSPWGRQVGYALELRAPNEWCLCRRCGVEETGLGFSRYTCFPRPVGTPGPGAAAADARHSGTLSGPVPEHARRWSPGPAGHPGASKPFPPLRSLPLIPRRPLAAAGRVLKPRGRPHTCPPHRGAPWRVRDGTAWGGHAWECGRRGTTRWEREFRDLNELCSCQGTGTSQETTPWCDCD